MRAKVIVDSTLYASAHGKLPRGTGFWAFCVVDPRRLPRDYRDYCIRVSGSYGKAKRIAQAVSSGVHSIIYVCA